MWPRMSSVPDDAETRHPPVPFPVPCTLYHSSVCSMNNYHHILMKYTSRLHAHSLLLTWCPAVWTNPCFPKRLKKETLLSRPVPTIFSATLSSSKSRGRKYQVCYPFVQEEEDPRCHYQVKVWRCLNSLWPSQQFCGEGASSIAPRNLSAAWVESSWDQPGIGEAPSASEEPNWLALTSSREPVINC